MSNNLTVNDWSDEQKSVMLAKAMGWEPTPAPMPDVPLLVMFKTNSGEPLYSTSVLCQMSLDNFWERHMPNLYYTQHMSLAWRVLNWAMDSNLSARARADIMALFYVDKPSALEIPPADAQRMWLDKIIELVIDPDMVEPGRNHPTEEGIKRYPPNGVYTGGFGEEDKDWWLPCTCTQKCETPCKGECGCQACDMAYNDFLSAE